MAKLPWSDNERTDYLTPCKLCSEESVAVGNGLCKPHMDERLRELITNSILKK